MVMSSAEMLDICHKHSLFSWSRGDQVAPIPVARAEGIYFYTPEGERWIDFNSQLMSVNIGHSHPKVIEAMQRQVAQLQFVYPGTVTEPRARLSALLNELVPGDISSFFYTLGGAEANENAVRAARLYSGRHKILARYRSYHGGTHLALSMTGDPRRWPAEPASPGIVHVMDPWPYEYSFGKDEDEITANHLCYLEEVIQYEGPHTIAAMIVETVTGTNGVLVPPRGWFVGLRALLDKYGILLICDEVMAGFGRTGKWLAYEHFGIVPDIVTMAKGLTSSYAPLGCMGVSRKIHDHFQSNVYWGGLTYNAHPVSLATAVAVLEVMRDEGIVEHAAAMGAVMRQEMDRLTARHPTIKQARNIGLFGMIDLQKDSKGTPVAPYNGSSPAVAALAAAFKKRRLFTFTRWNNFTCNPPLIITEPQLRECFAIVDECLEVTHPFFEG